MANVEIKKPQTSWHDIGKYESIKCKEIMETLICVVKFTNGDITIKKDELRGVCIDFQDKLWKQFASRE